MRAGGSERRPGACALERGEAVRSGSRAASAAAAQRAHARPRSGACTRAQSSEGRFSEGKREIGERKREWREKLKVHELT